MRRGSKLFDAKLYLVLDRAVQDYGQLFDILKISVRSGVDVVQLRDKKGCARDVMRFAREAIRVLKRKTPFIINDRLDLALAAGADGVHLGQEDLALPLARRVAGEKMLIGISCQTLAQARRAQKEGADYIGFGSVFKTFTKPERQAMDLRLLERVYRTITIPVFAIGGITLGNVEQLFPLGVNRVAVTRAISLARDKDGTVKRFKGLLEDG